MARRRKTYDPAFKRQSVELAKKTKECFTIGKRAWSTATVNIQMA